MERHVASLGLALLLVAQPCRAADPSPSRAADERRGDTIKERLSDKASDEQRVDNCNVPAYRRGAKKRPDCAKPPDGHARK